MTPIQKSHELISRLRKEDPTISREEIVYLYCLYFLYREIGFRLPETIMVNHYCNSMLDEIEEKLDNQYTPHSIDYSLITTETHALNYIKDFERKLQN